MSLAVEIKRVYKTYTQGIIKKRKKNALKGIDLEVPLGSIYGILGPNGAGKTTLISIISGLLVPDCGIVKVLGKHITSDADYIFRNINMCSGRANFLWSMTVQENLKYYAMLYGIPNIEQKIQQLLDLFCLKEYKDIQFEELSTGIKQRLSLAKAFINDPKLVLLDEPTVALDPDVAMLIRETIQQFHKQKGITFLISTHNMEEAKILCDEVFFIFDGQIKAKGSIDSIKRDLKIGDKICIEFFENYPSNSDISDIDGILDISVTKNLISIIVDDHKVRLPQLLSNWESNIIKAIEIHEVNLEDVFFNFSRRANKN